MLEISFKIQNISIENALTTTRAIAGSNEATQKHIAIIDEAGCGATVYPDYSSM